MSSNNEKSITVETKDELIQAQKKGYGTIIIVGMVSALIGYIVHEKYSIELEHTSPKGSTTRLKLKSNK